MANKTKKSVIHTLHAIIWAILPALLATAVLLYVRIGVADSKYFEDLAPQGTVYYAIRDNKNLEAGQLALFFSDSDMQIGLIVDPVAEHDYLDGEYVKVTFYNNNKIELVRKEGVWGKIVLLPYQI